jgi:hypothetical protein
MGVPMLWDLAEEPLDLLWSELSFLYRKTRGMVMGVNHDLYMVCFKNQRVEFVDVGNSQSF